jgi:ferric-dicitrate binding protein FerR (iron transport regulator)
MPTADEFIVFAEQCERMAKRLPEHSVALLQIAAAWRRLAEKGERDDAERTDDANLTGGGKAQP